MGLGMHIMGLGARLAAGKAAVGKGIHNLGIIAEQQGKAEDNYSYM